MMRKQVSDLKVVPAVSTARPSAPSKTAAPVRPRHAPRLDLIERICDIANDHLVAHVATLLINADKVLNAKLEAGAKSEDEKCYLTLQSFIKIEGQNINRQFFLALNEKLKPGNKKSAAEADELSLVSEEEMEEMVATTTMHAHAMNLCANELNHLEVRLEYLEITSDSAIEKESLNPRRLGEAFLIALKALNLDLKNRLALFAMFDIEVTPKLDNMYKTVNTLLIKAGVMPKIQLKDTEDKKAVETRSANYYDPQANVETNFVPRTAQEMAYFATQFFQGQFMASSTAVGLPESFTRPVGKREADGKNYFARNDVMKALSQLQNQIRRQGKEQQQANIGQIKQSLFSEMGKQSNGVITKQVNVLDERSIDFVGMMFDAITHDASLSSIIKNLLLRLQIPVIKVAMTDIALFEQDNHPTREVLNLVSEAGKGVTEESDRVYNLLETIIDSVLEEFDVDIESFNQAAHELRKLIASEQKTTLENEQREQKVVMVAHAREVVVNEIKHISANKRIPKNVLPLISKSWPSLMITRYIRHGNDSWPWLESVMLMRLLVKCLQPIKSNRQWQTLWSNHMALIEAVSDELNTSRQDKTIINDQIETLKDTFLELLDAYGYKLTEDIKLDSVTADELSPEHNIPAANDASDDEQHILELAEIARLAQEKLSQLPTMVHPGVWFEIYNGEDKAVRRLKLSVILTGIAKLVFVDRKGMKVIEKDAADFATELSSEKSRFIADHSTFEHALGQVIHSIAA